MMTITSRSCSSSCWVLNSVALNSVARRGAAVVVDMAWSMSVAMGSAGRSRMAVGARLSVRVKGAGTGSGAVAAGNGAAGGAQVAMGTAATAGGGAGSASGVDAGTDDDRLALDSSALVPPAGSATTAAVVPVMPVVPRSNIHAKLGELQYLSGGGRRVESITSDSVYLPFCTAETNIHGRKQREQ